MLSDRTGVSLGAAKAELAKEVAGSRQRIKTLKALIKVLEAEAPSPTDEEEAES